METYVFVNVANIPILTLEFLNFLALWHFSRVNKHYIYLVVESFFVLPCQQAASVIADRIGGELTYRL